MHITDEQWKALDRDISDRRGLKWEWSDIDEDVKIEIRKAWDQILFPKSQPADDVVERMLHAYAVISGFAGNTQPCQLDGMAAALAVAREGHVPAIKHVICNDCKGHQIFTTEGDTIYVLHDCVNGKHVREIWNQQKKDHQQQLASMYTQEQVEQALYEVRGTVVDWSGLISGVLARLVAPKQEQERVTIKLEKWSVVEQRYTIYLDGKPYLAGFLTEEDAKKYVVQMAGIGISQPKESQ